MKIKNCYFPLFVSLSVLQREKDHIEGFAPEVFSWAIGDDDSQDICWNCPLIDWHDSRRHKASYPDDPFYLLRCNSTGIRISESKVSSAFFAAITDFPLGALCQGSTTSSTEASSKPKKKICCACPDTKRLRDECIVEHGEAACTKWIEAHLQCLRSEGFKV
ncbi:hypothetical protein MRB53_000425 [Persea americana]|uniref:Uncharacterized protein n=1 Tax=Persea americana TaxID=3435 RepID=A0ACC2MR64_PERAE|nr:hypothetical protein MRB53_000425 [Persea americana]